MHIPMYKLNENLGKIDFFCCFFLKSKTSACLMPFLPTKMHSGMNFKICGSLCYSSVTQIMVNSLGITMYIR